MVASVWVSAAVKVCTADRLERRAEGKAEGLDVVTTICEEVSARRVNDAADTRRYVATDRGRRTFALGPADGAGEQGVFLIRGAIEKIAAVSTEDQRADGGHCADRVHSNSNCSDDTLDWEKYRNW